jgi:hypothetical protein
MSRIKKMKGLVTSRLVMAAIVAVIASAAATVVVSGISSASIPDGSGVIHGCYKTSGTVHALKVIDSAVTSSCPAKYTSLNWNQTGPQGPPGPAGTARDVGSVVSVGQGGPSFYSQGLKGWVSVTSPSTGIFCLTPDSSSTMANSALVVSDGSPGAFGLGQAFWGGYCSESPLVFRVTTEDFSGNLNNGIPFTAIVP